MKKFSVGISEQLSKELCEFLIREDGDEDLIFALWNSSNGNIRDTSLINELIFPVDNDRDRHGNVSFNPQYIKRVCKIAGEKNVVLHLFIVTHFQVGKL